MKMPSTPVFILMVIDTYRFIKIVTDIYILLISAKLLTSTDLDDIGASICNEKLDEAFEQVNFTDKAMVSESVVKWAP